MAQDMLLAADVFRDQRPEVLRRWTEESARAEVEPGRRRSTLLEGMPAILDELERQLRSSQEPRQGADRRSAGRSATRPLAQGFALDEVVAGYEVLRAVLFDVLAQAGDSVSRDDFRRVADLLAAAVADAVAQHTREAAAAVKKSEPVNHDLRRFRSLVEASTDFIAIATLEGGLRYTNPAGLRLVGLVTPEAGLKLTFFELFAHESVATARDVILPALLRGETWQGEVSLLHRTTGDSIPIWMQSAGVRGDAGEMEIITAIAQDLRTRKYQEVEREALLEETDWLRTRAESEREAASNLARERQQAFEILKRGDPLFLLDKDWRFTFANPAWEKLARLQPGEVHGRTFWDVPSSGKGTHDPFFENYSRAMRERIEVDFVAFDASAGIWGHVRAYPTSDGGLAVFVRDISARKKLEQEVHERADFERQLIGIVSHDLRNPLSAVVLGTQVMLRRQHDEKTTRALQRVQSSADKAVRLVRDLLDFTRARVGAGIPLVFAPADLHEIARSVIEESEAAAPDRKISFRTSGSGEGRWDKDRLGQVIQNLVANALKYSPSGTPVSVDVGDTTEGVVVQIHNLGTGIAADSLGRIFEPMQRGVASAGADNATKSLGLGLFIVRHLVEAHGGGVSVKSSEKTGTTFTIALPRAPPTPARLEAPDHGQPRQ